MPWDFALVDACIRWSADEADVSGCPAVQARGWAGERKKLRKRYQNALILVAVMSLRTAFDSGQ
jgi:hypothetical protein